jgi:protein-tyrosine phosphatase
MGGLPSLDGRYVRRGVLYRSEALLTPHPEDAARLQSLAIKLICDLRGHQERAAAPNERWHGNSIEIVEMDIIADTRNAFDAWEDLQGSSGAASAREMMLSTYRAFPAAAAGHLRTLFNRLAEGSVPLLIHCTAGKDRTGFVAALLLLALGVPLAAVYTDYLASNGSRNPAVVEVTRQIINRRLGGTVSEQALAAIW